VTLQAILWDFGDTLADETWMLAPLAGAPGWPAAYRRILGGGELADRWNLGRATAWEVASDLAAGLGVPAANVLAHMRACCRNLTFYADVMALAAEVDLPQAIVTINCDVFSEIVVPTYRLRERFQAIVTSWEEGTLSKADLCDIATSRLAGATDRASCLLVDNKLENVVDWRARGGAAWHFRDGASLTEHLSRLIASA